MHLHFLDPYIPRPSPVHQLDSRVKLVLTVAFILTVSLTPFGAWPVYILLFSIVFSVTLLSELGAAHVLKRSSLAVLFVLAALPVIFTTHGEPLLYVHAGAWDLVITLPGVERFASIALKSWISLQAAIILAASTPFPDLLVAMRALKIPRLLVAIFGLMWRYLFVLVDEALRLLRARTARMGQSDKTGLRTGGSIGWRAAVAGGMAGNLFLRAFERSDRIYLAMVARGYDGEVRSFALPRLNRSSRLILLLGLCLLAAMLGLSLLWT